MRTTQRSAGDFDAALNPSRRSSVCHPSRAHRPAQDVITLAPPGSLHVEHEVRESKRFTVWSTRLVGSNSAISCRHNHNQPPLGAQGRRAAELGPEHHGRVPAGFPGSLRRGEGALPGGRSLHRMLLGNTHRARCVGDMRLQHRRRHGRSLRREWYVRAYEKCGNLRRTNGWFLVVPGLFEGSVAFWNRRGGNT